MSRPETGFGEHYVDDIIRDVLREYANREKPIGASAIVKCLKEKGITHTPTVVRGFANRMGAREYVTKEECDEIIKECRADEREVLFVKKGEKGRTIGYWMMETISESEWMFLMDSVLYSKILTKKEADNLAKRITFLAGKSFSDLTKYRHKMRNQPYTVGDKEIDEKEGHIESRVLKSVHLIRVAIKERKKVEFNLCVYDYGDQSVRLVPYGKHGKVLPETPDRYREDVHRVVSPFEVIYSNGRYYMLGLGADLETERSTDLKYKLYRVDLMDDLSFAPRTVAITKKEAGIEEELANLFKYRMENPYMFTGKVERVRIRVDADQFTQIVDWFSDDFKVVGHDANEDAYYDIEVKVNLNSFTFWVLQYSGCVEVLETGKKGDDSYRNHIKETLKKALEKYEEDDK
ncbi:WYL domain-containing protein [Ligilactobacillus ruminis]|uniref:WYL domain-containing protein n=1 Tax=Ligilactobacillus ruminis TaxID=1623 RepID=UPI003F99930E